KTY
ncbi:Cell division protein FtsA, partial [Haemophilus influenzae]